MIKYIKKRAHDVEEFDISRIKNAIEQAYDAKDIPDKDDIGDIIESIKDDIEELAGKLEENDLVHVEQIQDIVEKNLIKFNKYEIAKAYILYRNEHNKQRQQEREEEQEKLEKKQLKVTKDDGKQEKFDMKKVKKTYDRIAGELTENCPFGELEQKLKGYLVDGIKTSDISRLIIKSAVDLISVENINWQFIAGRFSIMDLYKQASRNRNIKIKDIYSPQSFKDLFDEYINAGNYYKNFYEYYSADDILKAGEYIQKQRDMEYNYTTAVMLGKRYLLNPNKVIKELPQEMYMAVALFLAIPEPEEKRLEKAIEIYEHTSSQKISLPTPTLLNARTNFHQLSSCFKLNLDDDLRSIYHGVENMAQISKFGGGIGTYLGHIRSRGSTIRGIKGASGGVNPWIKVINDTAIAVNQLGSRAGAISTTIDIWHRDIHSFLDLQTESGDIRQKSYDVFPSVSIPDLFMKRLSNDENWTLFDPKEIYDKTGRRIEDNFGEDFEKFYEELENNEDIELKDTISAKELFKEFLKTTVETGLPYVFFRDTVNKYNPNQHTGNVYSTQLCTEICQNTSPSTFVEEKSEDNEVSIKYNMGDTVVCNLASINVAKVTTEEEMQKVIPTVMRVLDNVITLNFYPIKEAEETARKYRSVGLGFMGVAEYLATNHYKYDSPEAREVIDKLFEQYAYYAIKSSNELAKERGKYELFDGSEWSKGLVFGKDKEWFKNNSEISEKWSSLIDDIKENGLRFSYHLAPAPNTSTALVVGTTAGVLPVYKKYFVETNSIAPTVNVAPGLSKDNFWYYKEYVNMDMNEVIDMVSVMYKWVDQSISFEWIINPMEVSPKELFSYYIKAWKQGIKTVYYVRNMSLEVTECSSCSG